MAEKIVYAKFKNFSQKPRKARLVIDVVRGKKVDEAITTLKFMDQKAADAVLRVVSSAAANAVNNFGMDRSLLYIKEARIDGGMTRKKPFYRARGGMDLVKKQYSHIIIGVTEKEIVK